MPDAMSFLLERYPKLKEYHPPLAPAESIFESAVDRKMVMANQLLSFDAAMINGMLRDKGQPLLSDHDEESDRALSNNHEMTTALLSMLLTIICEQSDRIERLENGLK